MSKRKIFTLKNKRHMPTWLAWLLAWVVKLVSKTYRIDIVDPHDCMGLLQREASVFALWHNRFLFSATMVPRRVLEHCGVLVSASRDGEYVSTVLKCFGIQVIRGSSSRGGTHALFELCKAVKEGINVVLTVDGPRGPRYTVHPGAVAIARKCDVAIIPVAINAKRKWQLKSWDALQIPKPFSKVELVFGEPYKQDNDATVEAACETLRQKLLDITED